MVELGVDLWVALLYPLNPLGLCSFSGAPTFDFEARQHDDPGI